MLTPENISKAAEFVSDKSSAADALQKGAEGVGNERFSCSQPSMNSRGLDSLPSSSDAKIRARGTQTPALNAEKNAHSNTFDAYMMQSDEFTDRHAHFRTLLAEAGFSPAQCVLIDDALLAARLQIVEAE